MNKKAWTDWIDAVKEHYPDLEMIEVVNEAVKSANNYHSDFARSKLIEALGGDSGNYEFVVTAFKMARERWPKAIKNMWTHGIPTHPLDSLDSIALENSTAVNRKIQGNLLAQRFPSIREIIAPSKSLSSKAGLYVRHRKPQRGAAIHFKFSLF